MNIFPMLDLLADRGKMNIIRKFLGPKSKYDHSIPFTYLAEMPAIEGDDELFSYFFSDTICGLVEYLDENDISPNEVQIRGVYEKKEIPLDSKLFVNNEGNWLDRPKICRSLEAHFEKTHEFQYKGHLESGCCSFDDRDRKGVRV